MGLLYEWLRWILSGLYRWVNKVEKKKCSLSDLWVHALLHSSKARAPQCLKHFFKKYSIGCIITEVFENSPNTNFVSLWWWKPGGVVRIAFRVSWDKPYKLRMQLDLGQPPSGHRLVKPCNPWASIRGTVSEGCACLEVISVLSTVYRRINQKEMVFLRECSDDLSLPVKVQDRDLKSQKTSSETWI